MSKLVMDQNDEIRESIEKLKGQEKEIQFIGYQQSQQGKVNKDSDDKMNLTIKQFQIVKAQLNRLVVSQEEIVEEVIDNTPPPERYTQNTQTATSNSSGQYMIIAGNYLVQSNANEMSKKLKNLGFGSAEVATFDNSQYHTVIASRYSDYGKAVEASSNLKAKGIDCYVKKRS